MLLSDACLDKVSKNARMRFDQSNKLFIEHLYEKMQIDNLLRMKINTNMRYYKQYNKTYTSYSFSTLSFTFLTELYSQWYIRMNNRNIKIVPHNISELLNHISLAYWIMVLKLNIVKL